MKNINKNNVRGAKCGKDEFKILYWIRSCKKLISYVVETLISQRSSRAKLCHNAWDAKFLATPYQNKITDHQTPWWKNHHWKWSNYLGKVELYRQARSICSNSLVIFNQQDKQVEHHCHQIHRHRQQVLPSLAYAMSSVIAWKKIYLID